MSEVNLSVNILRHEFNRIRPALVDIDDKPLTEDVDTEALDAYGFHKFKDCITGVKYSIRYYYGREE